MRARWEPTRSRPPSCCTSPPSTRRRARRRWSRWTTRRSPSWRSRPRRRRWTSCMPMLKAGKIAEAVPYLESLTKSAPANAEVLYNLGIAYSELGQFDEAVIRLKRAVQLDPGHAHAWVGIGTAYHRMRKPEQALASVREGRRSRPQRRLHAPQPGRHADRLQAHRRGGDPSSPRPGPDAGRSAGDLRPGHGLGAAGHARGRRGSRRPLPALHRGAPELADGRAGREGPHGLCAQATEVQLGGRLPAGRDDVHRGARCRPSRSWGRRSARPSRWRSRCWGAAASTSTTPPTSTR